MSENTVTIELTELFDVKAMVKVFASHISSAGEKLVDGDYPTNDLRQEIMSLYKFTTECSKLSRNLVDMFDERVKTIYALEIVDDYDVRIIRVPQERSGAGRKVMTKEEKLAAAKKRDAKKLLELVSDYATDDVDSEEDDSEV